MMLLPPLKKQQTADAGAVKEANQQAEGSGNNGPESTMSGTTTGQGAGEANTADPAGGEGPPNPGGEPPGDPPPGKPPGGQPSDPSHPPSSAARKVLVLSQKGDWAACDQALKTLEREVLEGVDPKPLARVADNVSFRLKVKTCRYL